jgi:hypothetical protein
MTEVQTFTYEAFVGKLENGQQVLIQIFRNPDTLEVLASQLAFKTVAAGTWQTPYPLEKL